MRNIFIIIFIICTTDFVKAQNRIDQLKSEDDVINFIRNVDDRINEDFFLVSSDSVNTLMRSTSDCLSKEDNYRIVDVSNDGINDLIAYLSYYSTLYPTVILGSKTDSYEVHKFWFNVFENCEYLNTTLKDNLNLLTFNRFKTIPKPDSLNPFNYEKIFYSDTLLYKFGGFVEYGTKFSRNTEDISSINYSNSGCLGTCPVFSLSIKSNGNATLKAAYYNDELRGLYKTKINSETLDKILRLITYLDFLNLEDNYSVPWTDSSTAFIQVEFKDGTIKSIRDYGKQGTLGLNLLYSKLLRLRSSQDWEKKADNNSYE